MQTGWICCWASQISLIDIFQWRLWDSAFDTFCINSATEAADLDPQNKTNYLKSIIRIMSCTNTFRRSKSTDRERGQAWPLNSFLPLRPMTCLLNHKVPTNAIATTAATCCSGHPSAGQGILQRVDIGACSIFVWQPDTPRKTSEDGTFAARQMYY